MYLVTTNTKTIQAPSKSIAKRIAIRTYKETGEEVTVWRRQKGMRDERVLEILHDDTDD